jgi:hypothetical protein
MARKVRIEYENAYYHVSNHYHLLIQTPDANLVEGMK